MKTSSLYLLLVVLNTGVALTSWSQTSEFTYQGSLSQAGQLAHGQFDFAFQLFDASANRGQTLNLVN